MKFLTLTIVLLFSSLSLFSQTTAKGAAAPGIENISVVALDNADWSFYADDDNRTFYVDFEKINVNLSDVIIKNEIGEIVFKDDVVELPVNAIYELNFEELGVGDYTVELRSYTKIIQKNISIK
ncbi:MAG: hypothetical protein AB8F94_05020 [Saprospiraceae bacterium]